MADTKNDANAKQPQQQQHAKLQAITSPPVQNQNVVPAQNRIQSTIAAAHGYNPMTMAHASNPVMAAGDARNPRTGQMQRPPPVNHVVDPIEGVPSGLEALYDTDHLFVKPSVDFAEYLYNAANAYEVLDGKGRRIYFAHETTSFCSRNCCPGCAPFHMSVLNFMGQEILRVAGTPGCCGCNSNVRIFHGDTLLGSVTEICACCTPKFEVTNGKGAPEFFIRGPEAAGHSCVYGTAEFDVLLPDKKTQVGRISKQWPGYAQEFFTQADNFGMSFPMGLSTELKALLLGATFLIDFRFFENGTNENTHGNREGSAVGGTIALIAFIIIVIIVVLVRTQTGH